MTEKNSQTNRCRRMAESASRRMAESASNLISDSHVAVQILEQALATGQAAEAIDKWHEVKAPEKDLEGTVPVVFVTDPQDDHGAEYVKRTWGISAHQQLLEEARVTGERRLFASVMSREAANVELPPLDGLREAIAGDLPDGSCAWIFGVAGDRYVLSTVPLAN